MNATVPPCEYVRDFGWHLYLPSKLGETCRGCGVLQEVQP